jgi:hypothetical protein
VVVWDENDYSVSPTTNQVLVTVDTNCGEHGVTRILDERSVCGRGARKSGECGEIARALIKIKRPRRFSGTF